MSESSISGSEDYTETSGSVSYLPDQGEAFQRLREERDSAIRGMQQLRDSVQSRNQMLKLQLSDYENTNATNEKFIAELQELKRGLAGQLETVAEERRANEAAIRGWQEKVESMEAEMQRLKREKEQFRDRLEELKSDFQLQEQERAREHMKDLDLLKRENASLNNEINILKRKIESELFLKGQIEDAQREALREKKENEETSKKLAAACDLAAELRKANLDQEKRIDGLVGEGEASRLAISRIEDQLRTAIELNETLKCHEANARRLSLEMQEKENRLEGALEDLRVAEQKIMMLQQEHNKTQLEAQQAALGFANKLKNSEDQRNTIGVAFQLYKEEHSPAIHERQMGELREKMRGLEEEAKAALVQLQDQERLNANLYNDNAQLSSQVERLTAELPPTLQRYNALIAELKSRKDRDRQERKRERQRRESQHYYGGYHD